MDDLDNTQDTTKLIWEYYFRVRFPYLQARSIDHVKLLGVAVSGNKHVDSDLNNQLTTTYMTINTMVDYFKEGVPIRVIDIKDTKIIYDYISRHLAAWKDRLFRGINIGNAPIDDLIAMDYFANSVYEHAKYMFIDNLPDSITARYASSLQNLNPMNFFIKPASNIKEDDIAERDSYISFFKEKSFVNRRY